MQLRDSLLRWPDAKHYVVTHSHGGNITLRAIRESDIERGLTGVVCLATPFLHLRRRYLGPYRWEHLFMMSLLLLAVSGGVVLALLMERIPALKELPDFVVFVLSIIGSVAIAAMLVLWERWADGLIREWELPRIENSRLLIIRTSGDEAQGALSGLQAVGWLSTRVWVAFSRVGGWDPTGLLFLLASLALIPLVAVVSALLFAFSPALPLAGPFVDITVEPTPPGSWTVHQLPPLEDHRLSHSQSYNDPRSLSLIGTWMLSGAEFPL